MTSHEPPPPPDPASPSPGQSAPPPPVSDSPPRRPTRPADRPTDQTIKDTLESIIIAFALAFVFRAFVVEAFLIPTGSMAPTLLGQHLRVTDPHTGYRFAVGVDPPTNLVDAEGRLVRDQLARSPMTDAPITLDQGTHARPGDRILVLKYLYGISSPRRWDVVVFKAPHDPETNFIKRLVGLPNEEIALLDGNAYVKTINDGHGHGPDPGIDAEGWRIARKTDRPNIQRAVFQTLYDTRFVPHTADLDDDEHADWFAPWQPVGPAAHWSLGLNRQYRYDQDAPTTLRFDFDSHDYAGLDARYPYNQLKSPSNREPIEDIRLAVDLLPDRFGASVDLSTTARLPLNGQPPRPARLIARIDDAGNARLLAQPLDTDGNPTADPSPLSPSVDVGPLSPHRPTSLELWHVDQHAILWVDGRRALEYRYDPPLRDLVDAPAPAATPAVAIRLAGSPVTLQRVVLDRDLYTAGFPRDLPARGALNRVTRLDQPAIQGEPLTIGPDRFWCIGDNSPQSDDGRFWNQIDANVQRRFFDPDEFEDGRSPVGLVPRDLMVGRAFFVYFPAPLAITPDRRGIVPNLADMRFIR